MAAEMFGTDRFDRFHPLLHKMLKIALHITLVPIDGMIR
jgi:hypothetical protein